MIIILIGGKKFLLPIFSGHVSSSIKLSIKVPKQDMRNCE